MDTQALIASLEASPSLIIGLVHEVPPGRLKHRPAPDKWSAHEHACHLATGDREFRERLDRMLAEPHPTIRPMVNTPEESAGSLLDLDLGPVLETYTRERALTVARLRSLTPEQWERTAHHELYRVYSVYIMFRHLLIHELYHAYRIDEVMLAKDFG